MVPEKLVYIDFFLAVSLFLFLAIDIDAVGNQFLLQVLGDFLFLLYELLVNIRQLPEQFI